MINILGTYYTVSVSNSKKNPRLKDFDGFCDASSKEICVNDFTDMDENDERAQCKDVKSVIKRVLLHEIIHAFLFESGLDANSNISFGGWAVNEEMVDWIACQYFKIGKAFDAAAHELWEEDESK